MAGGKKKTNKKTIIGLIAALILVVVGGVLFVGAASGWFSGPSVAIVDEEYRCENKCHLELKDIDSEEYEKMVSEGKSCIVMIDQGGCKTAGNVREFAQSYSNSRRYQIFRIMFSDIKENSLGEYVKYYPSVAVVSKGRVLSYLRADSDEDAPAYNTYSDFENWLDQLVR